MNIQRVEGIGPVNASKLLDAGIRTTNGLLKAGASKKGRQVLSASSGISEHMILEWVNRADLMRVKGVGEEYSDLLEAAGVDTVKELRNRNPDNLHKAMLKVNEAKHLVRRPPSLKEVQGWVKNAKALDPMVTH